MAQCAIVRSCRLQLAKATMDLEFRLHSKDGELRLIRATCVRNAFFSQRFPGVRYRRKGATAAKRPQRSKTVVLGPSLFYWREWSCTGNVVDTTCSAICQCTTKKNPCLLPSWFRCTTNRRSSPVLSAEREGENPTRDGQVVDFRGERE